MPGQSRTPCWCPNRRRAMRQSVSNPDCAVDARPRSRREQYRLSAPPSVIGGESPLLARSLASSFLDYTEWPFLFEKAFQVRRCSAAFGQARFFTAAGRLLLIFRIHIFHTQDAHAFSVEST